MRQTKKLFVFILLVSMLLSSTTLSTKVNAQEQSGIDTFGYKLFELNKIDEKSTKLENAEFEVYNESGEKLQFKTFNNETLGRIGKGSAKLYASFPFKIEYHSRFPLNGHLAHGDYFDPNFEEIFNEGLLSMLNNEDATDKITSDKK
ncbi:hypothetical protein [Helcococcus kunzii]|uniref:hypothetical protein n=1 Tax=Helcococcus kunzii TaxID=40091 RepID=UPI0038AE2AF4